MEKKIEKFISKRPECLGVYGYGSGVFKQVGYEEDDKVQLDLIFIVEDIKKWNVTNIEMNPTDYSKSSKKYFTKTSREKLMGLTGITYLSNIEEDGNTFKYGVVDYEAFKNSLSTWNSFYVPGRFQKTIKEFKSNDDIRKLIIDNRRSAVITSLLISDSNTNVKNLLVKLCQLSYAGDTRMAFAENPRKVLNIVEGSYDKFIDMYLPILKEYSEVKEDEIVFGVDILKQVFKLPKCLAKYLKEKELTTKESRELEIMNYLSEINKKESKEQTMQGLKTNGLSKSIGYALAKVKKRFKK